MNWRDLFYQVSSSQATLHDNTTAANNWATGITSNYRSYNPANSKYKNVAATRAGNFDPQRSFSNLSGTGRFATYHQWYANSSQDTGPTANRISYLAPSASRPTIYHWGQDHRYLNPVNAVFSNQTADGINFYRLSDGNKIVLDSYTNGFWHWLYYNHTNLDNNLLTISNAGAVSKIEGATVYQDTTTTPSTPFLFQTHGGIPENGTSTWRTDYVRDANWQADDRDTYIIYRPNFGSNVQLPTILETMGEWNSNPTGERSGS